ncbi:MAG: glutathione peroxidase [Bacteroidales bacterium]|nr:glutathione peroxidase [Bacteroidales bacterium]
MKIKRLLTLGLLFCSLMLSFGSVKAQKEKSFYDFKMKSLDGQTVDFSKYRGKVVLVVNTASRCGLTPQYEALERLYKTYEEKGLVILGFPCNQFLGQEPGDAEQIQSFCTQNYGVSFPMFEKIDVNGKNEAPLYTFLKKKAPFKGYPDEEFGKQLDEIHKKTGTGFEKGDNIRWNFGKFLISKDGTKIIRFEPMVTPDEIEKYIVDML